MEEFKYRSLLTDVLGFIQMYGESPSFKEIVELGYSKADVADFSLGMNIYMGKYLRDDEVKAMPISPDHFTCICGARFPFVDEIYKMRDEDSVQHSIICRTCKNQYELLDGLEPVE